MIDFHMATIIGSPIQNGNRKTEPSLYQNSDMGTLGQRLKACRKESGLKQAEVCTRTGIAQGTLSELENDKYPTSSFVPHFASLYGVEALWLAEERGPKYRTPPSATRLPDGAESAGQDSPAQQFADQVKEEVSARDVPEHIKQAILTLLTSSPEKKK